MGIDMSFFTRYEYEAITKEEVEVFSPQHKLLELMGHDQGHGHNIDTKSVPFSYQVDMDMNTKLLHIGDVVIGTLTRIKVRK